MEGLTALIRDRITKGALHGCMITPHAPVASHLLFADDSLFFFQATLDEARVLKQCFSRYEAASGQKINFQKSSILFSPNVNSRSRQAVVNCLEVQEVGNHGFYLGLPSTIDRSKKDIFYYIVIKAHKKSAKLEQESLVNRRKGDTAQIRSPSPISVCNAGISIVISCYC